MLSKAATLMVLAAVIAPFPAHATVTISAASTQNMTCGKGLCYPTKMVATLNVDDLESLLLSGPTEVTTTGSGVQAGNISVSAAVVWKSANALTLNAYRSITINKAVLVDGTAALVLTTNDGGSGGLLDFKKKGHVAFASLSSGLTINGSVYTLASDIKSLANAIAKNSAGYYAFANSYDASQDGTYKASPVSTTFTGIFEGLGNSISNLQIADGNDLSVGFFAEIGSGGSVSDFGLTDANVSNTDTAYYTTVGALAGINNGVISNSYATGSVTGTLYPNTNMTVGGLVGEGGQSLSVFGTIENSFTNIVVTGGLESGGLVGEGFGPIKHCFATGAVSESYNDGGLVGVSFGPIEDSYATGDVSSPGWAWVGGLVGGNAEYAPIIRSFATGAVSDDGGTKSAPALMGGLVGANNGVIKQSYSTGSVSDSAAPGNDLGGLVGYNSSAGGISQSYSTGAVSDVKGNTVGGLIGDDEHSGYNERSYWDTDSSGITDPSQGAGNIANDPGIKGRTTKQLQSGLPRGFSPKVWSEDSKINNGLPYLTRNPPPK